MAGFFKNLLPHSDKPAVKSDGHTDSNIAAHEQKRDLNIIHLLTCLTPIQYALFFSGWYCWMMDSYDFFAVSLSLDALGETYGRDTYDMSTAITLTLLLRSLGAIIFGLLADRYGRRWVLSINMVIVGVFSLATAYCKTFGAFLGVRCLFGIGMGGIWGMSAATALESLPAEARGLFSGILQQGYAFGYLIAAVVNLAFVPDLPESVNWRGLFYLGAGLSWAAAMVRAALPESKSFILAKQAEKEAKARGEVSSESKTLVFLRETKAMLKTHWITCIYGVLLMTGFNFLSHGSQDLYPTYVQKSKCIGRDKAQIATIIGNCGAIAGGTVAGWLSQRLGRRWTMILFICSIGCWIPLWILPDNFSGLAAGAFWVQFGVQGAWGIIPIHLNELSPPAYRSTFPGVAYQLGNMVSSASAQIEATAGRSLRTFACGEDSPDYGKVQGILIGVVAVYTIVLVAIGKENHGANFEEAKTAFQQGGGVGESNTTPRHRDIEEIGEGRRNCVADKQQDEMVENADGMKEKA